MIHTISIMIIHATTTTDTATTATTVTGSVLSHAVCTTGGVIGREY